MRAGRQTPQRHEIPSTELKAAFISGYRRGSSAVEVLGKLAEEHNISPVTVNRRCKEQKVDPAAILAELGAGAKARLLAIIEQKAFMPPQMESAAELLHLLTLNGQFTPRQSQIVQAACLMKKSAEEIVSQIQNSDPGFSITTLRTDISGIVKRFSELEEHLPYIGVTKSQKNSVKSAESMQALQQVLPESVFKALLNKIPELADARKVWVDTRVLAYRELKQTTLLDQLPTKVAQAVFVLALSGAELKNFNAQEFASSISRIWREIRGDAILSGLSLSNLELCAGSLLQEENLTRSTTSPWSLKKGTKLEKCLNERFHRQEEINEFANSWFEQKKNFPDFLREPVRRYLFAALMPQDKVDGLLPSCKLLLTEKYQTFLKLQALIADKKMAAKEKDFILQVWSEVDPLGALNGRIASKR